MTTTERSWGDLATTTEGQPPPPPPADLFSVTDADLDGGPTVAFDGQEWVEQPRPVPSSGWRGRVWKLTGGRVNPGPDPQESRLRTWMSEIRRPFGGARTVAVVSTKGGVGKTTTALNLGHTFASIRGDRVVALDANPDAGSLGYRVRRQTDATAAEMLRDAGHLRAYADIRRYTSQAASNLEVVASPDDPRMTRRLGRAEYERLLGTLRVHYNLVVADCGTGILDSATRGVVQRCDQLVVVSGASVDAARAVSYLLAWLCEHGLADLVRRAVVVVNGVRPGRRPVDLDALTGHFATQVQATCVVPWDPELANGAAVELEWLAPATRQAYVRLAAHLIDNLCAEPVDRDLPPTSVAEESDPTVATGETQ